MYTVIVGQLFLMTFVMLSVELFSGTAELLVNKEGFMVGLLKINRLTGYPVLKARPVWKLPVRLTVTMQ